MTDLSHLTTERRSRMEYVLDHRQPDLAVVMENIGDFHNIAAVMRTCDAVGVQDIYILNTDNRIENEPELGFKSSRSANRWITVHVFTDLDSCVQALRERYDRLFCTHLSSESMDVYHMDFTTTSIALAFGNEQHGVTEELLAHCDGNFIIPQVGMIKSLNISVACAVTLYEAYRQKIQAGHYSTRKMTEVDADHLLSKWSQKVR